MLTIRQVTLGVPLEGRLKTWNSIQEKLERKSLELEAASDLDDLVGLRIILLFRSDLNPVLELLKTTFNVLSIEDAASRLGDAQFGYQSQHLILRLPDSWAGIPSLSDLTTLKAEVQVRTVAQHIWAAASHKLQYKQEESVPPPLRRTIYRISALLETVDLELDRVLEERSAYTQREIGASPPDETLNVDLLRTVLDDMLPTQNKAPEENYAELLQELLHFDILNVESLKKLLSKHMKSVKALEEQQVERTTKKGHLIGSIIERADIGVYFSHVGLGRVALSQEVGDAAFQSFKTSLQKERGASVAKSTAPRRCSSKPREMTARPTGKP